MKLASLPRGAIVLVAFPFTDLSATKVRPALVLSGPDFHRRTQDAILAAISSVVPPRPAPTSVVLPSGDAAFTISGLRVESVFHCGKLVTVQGKLIFKYLGRLGPSTLRRVDQALARAVGIT